MLQVGRRVYFVVLSRRWYETADRGGSNLSTGTPRWTNLGAREHDEIQHVRQRPDSGRLAVLLVLREPLPRPPPRLAARLTIPPTTRTSSGATRAGLCPATATGLCPRLCPDDIDVKPAQMNAVACRVVQLRPWREVLLKLRGCDLGGVWVVSGHIDPKGFGELVL